MADQLTCRSCGALNRRGPAACENCGALLRGAVPPWNIADALWRERVIWGGVLFCAGIWLRNGTHSRWVMAISSLLQLFGLLALSPRAIKWWSDRAYAWRLGVLAAFTVLVAFVVGPDARWTLGGAVLSATLLGVFFAVLWFVFGRRRSIS